MTEPATSTTEPTTAPVTEPTTEPTAPPAAKGDESGTGNGDMIPKGRFDEVNNQRKELADKLAKFEAAEQAAADEKAKREGDAEKFQKERDEYKSKAERWDEYAKAELDELTADFDEGQKDLMSTHDGSPLDVRLAAAKKLAKLTKTESEPKSFGTGGGPAGGAPSGLIPSDISSPAEYTAWMATLGSTPEGRVLLLDKAKMATVHEEAKRRKFRA